MYSCATDTNRNNRFSSPRPPPRVASSNCSQRTFGTSYHGPYFNVDTWLEQNWLFFSSAPLDPEPVGAVLLVLVRPHHGLLFWLLFMACNCVE